MSGRREVRVADSFFARLDEQFGAERGPSSDSASVRLSRPATVMLLAVAHPTMSAAAERLPVWSTSG